MDAFFNFLKFIAVLLGIIIVIFLVLLALPNSKLQQSIKKQGDDAIAAISALATAITSYISWQKSKQGMVEM